MSSRPQIDPHTVIPSPNASPANSGSMAVNITSEPTIILKLSMPSYSYSWVGSSPVGTVSVQISNDYKKSSTGAVLNSGTWTTIYFQLNGTAMVNSAPVSGNSGNGFIDVPITGAYAIRTVYQATSGTGTLTAIINAKVS